MSPLQPEYLDAHTPAEVVVRDRVRPPVEDPTLGVELGSRATGVPAPPANPDHPLVTIGDSLTHGLMSGAVSRTDLSWPTLVARSLGIPLDVPSYGGPLGGLPFNLEGLLRELQRRFGDRLNTTEVVALPIVLQRLADANEEYWESGEGSRYPRTDVHYHNLGIYGWDVRDSLSYTAARAASRVTATPAHDDLLGALPANDNDIAAWSVLAPFGPPATQLEAAVAHGENGGIDTLIVALGANNALRAVIDKKVAWSDTGFADLDRKAAYNVWRPSHFASEFAELARALETIRARRVVLATVPHVTIAPIARGVNPEAPGTKWRPGSRYFPYYADPWVGEVEFRPAKHRHLTHQQVRAVDSAIDQYNDAILEVVRDARVQGRDWYLFDLCGVLDSLAFRRFAADAEAAERNGWRGYELPDAISDLDTRFFRSDDTGRTQGGLFGLDGVHPTTCGYGIIAEKLLDVLRTAGLTGKPIDFTELRRQDTLNQDPPALLNTVFDIATPFLNRLVSRSRGILRVGQ